MSQTDSHTLFSQTSPRRLFLRAAIPGSAGMLLSSIYSLVDVILVGRYVGETAFAAVSLAIPFIILAFAVGDLIGAGSQAPISIALGKKDDAYANQIFTCSTLMNIVTGAAMGAVFYFAAPAIMAAMGATGQLAKYAVEYLRIYALFLPFTTVLYAVDNYLRISGLIRWSFLMNLFCAVFGAALEYWMLAVLGWGIRGAALAYSLAMTLTALLSFAPFIGNKRQLKFVRPRPTVKMLSDVVSKGMPMFLDNTSSRVASIAINIALLRLGGEQAVSVWGVLMNAGWLAMSLIIGMVDSLQPAVGYNWGATELSRVKEIEFYCFGVSAAVGLCFALAMQVFPDAVTLVFLPEADEELLAMSVHALKVFGLSYVIRWLPTATQSFMIAVGQTRLASLITIVVSLIAPVSALILLWPLELEGLWLNMPLASVISALVSVYVLWRFRSTVHERLARA